jgi:hypothetical protein
MGTGRRSRGCRTAPERNFRLVRTFFSDGSTYETDAECNDEACYS